MNRSARSSLGRSQLVSLVLAGLVIALALVFRAPLAAWFGGKSAPESSAPPMSASASPAVDHFTCSMHPSVKQPGPGKCPICGMDLVPVSKEQAADGVVWIDDSRRQLIGVRTAAVTLGLMHSSFHAVGHVSYDESAFTDVSLKVRGWVTKLLVNETGQRVQRGQPLLTLYSPDLYSAEQDFLLASRGSAGGASSGDAEAPRGAALARAARTRLTLLGLSDAQIDAVATAGEPAQNAAVFAPATGFVIEKDVVEGAAVEAGMRLFRIAALNRVWVEADVYEADLARVRLGQRARVTLDYLPGHAYDAKVSYVYPYLEQGARTGRVRIELGNPELELRPGMYANVELESELGPRLQVPASAVVYTGPRRLVFMDLGAGRFLPREVRVGAEADGMYEVQGGLEAGDRVAISGVFLIAAEARISTAVKYWESDSAASESAPPPEPLPALATPPPRARPKQMPLAPAPAPRAPGTPSAAAPLARFSCPMHPNVTQSEPGKCRICGMDLRPSGPEPAR